jgi:hypothetical protein
MRGQKGPGQAARRAEVVAAAGAAPPRAHSAMTGGGGVGARGKGGCACVTVPGPASSQVQPAKAPLARQCAVGRVLRRSGGRAAAQQMRAGVGAPRPQQMRAGAARAGSWDPRCPVKAGSGGAKGDKGKRWDQGVALPGVEASGGGGVQGLGQMAPGRRSQAARGTQRPGARGSPCVWGPRKPGPSAGARGPGSAGAGGGRN